MDTGYTIGLLFPITVFLALAILAIYFFVRRKRNHRKQNLSGSSGAEADATSKKSHLAPHVNRASEKPTKTDSAAAGIFLCYRRSDSADVAGRIYDRLVAQYGKQAVFKDVDSIPLGVDFRTAIAGTIERCNVFLAVIGPDWCDKTKAGDRLEDPRDHVRIEIEAALHREIPVIPILVRRATMPDEKDLPEKISALAYRNGISVRADPDFNHDVARLIAGVDEHLGLPFG